MPASLPVPSKGALRALRSLALGTSCTVAISAGLLTEDRRRRINTAREVHDNAKKLKSARQYHGGAGLTIETFEKQASRYREDAFWLPSNVLQDTSAAFDDGGRGVGELGHEIREPENVPSSRPYPRQGMLRGKLPSIKRISGFGQIPVVAPRDPVTEGPSTGGSEVFSRQSNLSLSLNKLLHGNTPDVEAAAFEFFEAFGGELTTDDSELGQEVIESAIRLSIACREQSRLDLSDKVFDVILAHGPISEEHFYSFAPEDVISRLVSRQGPPGPMSNDLDPAKLKKASSIYLTKFTEKPKNMTPKMFTLGDKLCLEAMSSRMDGLVLQLYARMERSRGDRPLQSVQHLIIATHRKGLHKKVFGYFQKLYTQTSPDQLQFYNVCSAVIDSLIEVQRLDLAEQVLISATRMAEAQNLRTSSTWILKVLGHDWRSHRNIGRTRALFDRLENIIPTTQHPQAIYSTIVQFCVEAREEAVAEMYYDKLLEFYGHVQDNGRIHGHFALAKAYRYDWPGVFEEFVKVQQASPDDIEVLSSCFTPVLHEYAKSHSLAEVEDYISLFETRFGLKITVPLMNLMAAAYGKAKEIDCMARWIDFAVADGCAVDATTVNAILTSCYEKFDFSFEEIYQLFLSVREKADKSTNLLDFNTVALLRKIAVATTKDPSEMLDRLKPFDKDVDDRNGVYRSMSEALAKKDPEATLRMYKHAQADEIFLEHRHLMIAVKASLRVHEDDVGETARIIQEARQRGIHVGSAIANVFVHQITKLFAQGVAATGIADLCQSTITAFEESGTEVPLAVVTHAASYLQRRGDNGAAIDLWNSMSSRLEIPPSSFDLASITSLLNAYIGLQDHAGVRWAVSMLSANNLRPDKHFKLLLNNARRETTRIIELQPCSNQVHEFLDSILESLARIKVMRENARIEQTQVKAKTIKIIEKAIGDQKAQESGRLQSMTELQRVKLNAGVQRALPKSAFSSKPGACNMDDDDFCHNVDIQAPRLGSASLG